MFHSTFDSIASKDRWLFLDMNSFFASVEQQERPELRNRPVAVAPMLSDATCVIAASYAAKPFGVKTGVNIKAAKDMCPELTVVEARPKLYIDYHRRLIETVRQELPDPKTLSVDEIACRLWQNEREAGGAVRLALHLKARLHTVLGACMTSSIGIAPNVFLAKVAADLHKPDGLTIVGRSDILAAFTHLQLRDLPGIGKNMAKKLHGADIHTVEQLYAASEADLGRVWGGVVGKRWWYMLRGSSLADYAALSEPAPKSVSNSHVVEPGLRSSAGAETILLRLLNKAATRMRIKGQTARRMCVSVSFQSDRFRRQSWTGDSGRTECSADLFTWLPIFRRVWEQRPRLSNDFVPRKVGVTFSDLVPEVDVTGVLFDHDERRRRLADIMDSINETFRRSDHAGKSIDVASLFWLSSHAPERIAFRKITDDDREKTITTPGHD